MLFYNIKRLQRTRWHSRYTMTYLSIAWLTSQFLREMISIIYPSISEQGNIGCNPCCQHGNNASLRGTRYLEFCARNSNSRKLMSFIAVPPFINIELTLIPAWIRNYMPRKLWGEITNPFLIFNGCTTEVNEWISNFIPHFTRDVIKFSMLGKK